MKQSLRNHLYVIFSLLIVIGLFTFAMIEGGFVSWFLFYSFLIVALYMIGAYLYPIQSFEVTRILSQPTFEAGDTVAIEIRVKRKIPFPLFYAFCEEVLDPSLQRKDRSNAKFKDLHKAQPLTETKSYIALVPMLFRRSLVLKYSIPHIPRGAHTLHTITLRTSDLFGCIKKSATFSCISNIQVYPRVRPLLYIHNEHSFQLDSGPATSVMKGIQSTLPAGVREYSSGDRISWIDWKQTAKKNEMMTKEFEREQDTKILFVFDHVIYDQMNMLAFEGAVETTVAMLHHLSEKASHTELISVGSEIKHMNIDQGEIEQGSVAHHFMEVTPERGDSFAHQIEEYGIELRQKALTCVISSRITEETVHALENIHMRTGSTLFICIMAKDARTAEVNAQLDALIVRGIHVCVLSEDELSNEPLEVIAYGSN